MSLYHLSERLITLFMQLELPQARFSFLWCIHIWSDYSFMVSVDLPQLLLQLLWVSATRILRSPSRTQFSPNIASSDPWLQKLSSNIHHFEPKLDKFQIAFYWHLYWSLPHTRLPKIYDNWIKSCFIDNSIEWIFREIHRPNIHLYIFEIFTLLFVFLCHSFDRSLGDIDIRDFLISIIKHLFTESYFY